MDDGKVTRKEFGAAVRTLRRMNIWTQGYLGRNAGVSNEVVSRIETGMGTSKLAREKVRTHLLSVLKDLPVALRLKDVRAGLVVRKATGENLSLATMYAMDVLGLGQKKWAAKAKAHGSALGSRSWWKFLVTHDATDLAPQDVAAITTSAREALTAVNEALAMLKRPVSAWGERSKRGTVPREARLIVESIKNA